MIGAPILVRISERSGHDQLAMFLAYFGYTWMGIVFLFVAASLTVYGYRIIIWIISFLLPQKLLLQINPKPAFYTPLIFSLVISIVGAFEAWDIKIEKVTLAHEKIPHSLSGIRIVQISDVHLGLIVRHKRLREILEAVQEANPDILVSTGDLVDGQIFPFNIITLLYFPIHWGCLNPIDHCYLYVSRGSGTWGLPLRFLSPPEVTLIELVSQN